MKKLIAVFLIFCFSIAALVFTAGPSNAMPCDGPGCTGESNTGYPGNQPPNISCSIRIIEPEIPAKPPITDVITVPAVTQTLFEFVHKNENHPNSPRWEEEGWNSDSNENSVGWYSTGNVKEEVITPAYEETVVIFPGTPAVPAVTEEECITQPSIPTTPITPVEEIVSTPIAPAIEAPAKIELPSTVSTPSVDPAPVAQTASTTELPAQLANTGAKEDRLILFTGLAVIALILGLTIIRAIRRH